MCIKTESGKMQQRVRTKKRCCVDIKTFLIKCRFTQGAILESVIEAAFKLLSFFFESSQASREFIVDRMFMLWGKKNSS